MTTVRFSYKGFKSTLIYTGTIELGFTKPLTLPILKTLNLGLNTP